MQGKYFEFFSDAAVEPLGVCPAEFLKSTFVQSLTDALHQFVVKIQIVHDGKPHGQHFFCFEQMAQVRAGIAAADRAVTGRVDGLHIALVFRVFQIDGALPGEELRVARIARRA